MIVVLVIAIGWTGSSFPSFNAQFPVFSKAFAANSSPRKDQLKLSALPGDLISLVALFEGTKAGDPPKIGVILTDLEAAKPARQLITYEVTSAGSLVQGQAIPVPAKAAVFDHCPTGPRQAMLLVATDEGLIDLLSGRQIVGEPTIYAHNVPVELPRLKLCFDLYPEDSSPALVVPGLAGISVYRPFASADRSQPLTYKLELRVPVSASMRFGGRSAGRHQSTSPSQAVSLALDYPQVSVVDLDGNGHPDLCLARAEELECYLQNSKGKISKKPDRLASFAVRGQGNSMPGPW